MDQAVQHLFPQLNGPLRTDKHTCAICDCLITSWLSQNRVFRCLVQSHGRLCYVYRLGEANDRAFDVKSKGPIHHLDLAQIMRTLMIEPIWKFPLGGFRGAPPMEKLITQNASTQRNRSPRRCHCASLAAPSRWTLASKRNYHALTLNPWLAAWSLPRIVRYPVHTCSSVQKLVEVRPKQ